MKIKVIVTDDHKAFREGLETLLFSAPDIEVVAQAVNGLDAIKKAKHFQPDLMLLDIAMPEMDGIEATRILKRTIPELKIIIVSMHSDDQYIKSVLEAGADGYLLKNSTYQQLTNAIHSVCAGKKFLGDNITEIIINGCLEPSSSKEEAEGYSQLSDREKEIFIFIAEGKTTQEIGDQLFISSKTVETHKQNILEKLKLKTDADMVKYALKNGLIQLN